MMLRELPKGRTDVPRIIVQADARDGSEAAVLMAERVNVSDFESRHFSDQLVERIGWAVFDAVEAEEDDVRSTSPAAPKATAAPEAPVAAPRAVRRREARRPHELVSA
jgi:hypothetical protein